MGYMLGALLVAIDEFEETDIRLIRSEWYKKWVIELL